MAQHLALDVRALTPYYRCGALMLLAATAGCARGLKSIAPVGMVPVSGRTVAEWLSPYQPAGSLRFDLRWRFVNQKGSTAGRASVRIAPPDTFRFDYRGPFGRAGAALIVGDSVVWAVPEREARDLVPAAPLFWVALGMPRKPPAPAEVRGVTLNPGHAWRYATAADTMDFVEAGAGPDRLLTEVRRQGRIVASTETHFAAVRGAPSEARIRFPVDGSALIFTVEGIEHVAAFEPSTWRRP